jgi:AraC family transcriptional regulator
MAEVEIKEVPPMTVMCHSFTGPYDQTQHKLAHLMGWLLRAGHPYSSTPFGLYYEDPARVPPDQLRAEVCAPIEEECEPGDDIERKDLPGVTVAAAIHRGPYEEVPQLYQEVFAWMAENGYEYAQGEPTREIFLTMYGEAEDAEEFVTEVQVPLKQD